MATNYVIKVKYKQLLQFNYNISRFCFNIMNTFNPINLVNTSLNISEEHYFSYTINPLRKQFNVYYPSLEYYTVHLTNERLILESYINDDILTNFYRIYSFLPVPENLLAIINKSRIHQAKKSMELIKYKSISLYYNLIDSLNGKKINQYNIIEIILIDNNHEIKAFKMLGFDAFKIYPVEKITFEYIQNIFIKNNSNSNFHFNDANYHFLLFVNAFSKEYKEKLTQLNKQKQ